MPFASFILHTIPATTSLDKHFHEGRSNLHFLLSTEIITSCSGSLYYRPDAMPWLRLWQGGTVCYHRVIRLSYKCHRLWSVSVRRIYGSSALITRYLQRKLEACDEKPVPVPFVTSNSAFTDMRPKPRSQSQRAANDRLDHNRVYRRYCTMLLWKAI